MSEALEALCSHLGVALSYEDAWGRRTDVPEDSQRAILAALGHPLEGDDAHADAAAKLAQLRAAAAQRVLPPALVLEASGGLQLSLHLPAAFAGRALPWRLALENGGERRGIALARLTDAEQEQGADDADDEPRAMTMVLNTEVPTGRHALTLFEPGRPPRPLAQTELFVCPTTCFDPTEERGVERMWGLAIQVYALRSGRDWGMGDFGALSRLVDLAADGGAHFIGVNPLHALFPHDPERASPYSPSSREWLNVLYLDIEAMRDFGECVAARELVDSAAFDARLDELRSASLIDYTGVAAAKFEVFELLYAHFRSAHLDRGTQRAGLFRDFQREGGRSLRLHALFDALQEYFHARDRAVWGWTLWPAAYHDVDGPDVEAFALENEARIEFFEYLQWQADAQLHAVAMRTRARGMRVGLYRDLAVGVNEGGSETWARPEIHANGMHAGAPPDELNAAGQDWGFPPVIPQRMAEEGYAGYLAVLRANMRHAGALRIDHVMSLMRLFWLPTLRDEGGAARIGAYVAYPMEALFRLLCLESRRRRCIVIGEDLGIVPPPVREAMGRHGVLFYRPLYFERLGDDEGGGVRPPARWPGKALAVVGTHDLPTLTGYWTGADLRLREELGMAPDPDQREQQVAQRDNDRRALRAALREEGVLDADADAALAAGEADPRLALATYRFIGRTPAELLAVQLEDVLEQVHGVNLPGTSEGEHPNWRRRLDAELADIAVDPRWREVAAAINEERFCPPLPMSGGPRGFRPEQADVPRATYRLQFHRNFRFSDAQAVLPYLAALGISHIYAAPFLKARPGSLHGYDIVDHDAVNPEVGGEEEFDRYCEALRDVGLGQVLDVVPNHVGVLGADNQWWLDVLENGPSSEYADYFDIDWDPPFSALKGKVLLPVLGDQYGKILESGELALAFGADDGEFSVRYFEHRFPIDPAHYPQILEAAGGEREADGDEDAGAGQVELETLLAALRHLPPRDAEAPELRAERRRNKELFKEHLADLYGRLPAVRERVDAAVAAFAGQSGEPRSFDALDELLARQGYRLASWRVAADDINYRRFFDINDLAALRMDRQQVFDATHAQIFRWIGEGRASGLRIDHPDGLSDPEGYFERLQERYAQTVAGDETRAPTLYLVVEKILGEFETVPDNWPVHGDTGYRFANLCNNLFVDAAQESRFSRIYRSFTGEVRDFGEVLHEAKHLIMTHSLSGDLGGLAHLLHAIAQQDRSTRDFTHSRLRGALMEIIASFPVYRSYISPRGLSDSDRRYIERAVEDAAMRGRAGDASVLHFVRDVLLSAPNEPDATLRRRKLSFARRFQQFTAPVMAKSMEDTAFYRYNRLISLNDVGGDPRTFGIAVEDFHVAHERLACTHPFEMRATSSHDSKRSEDVRARIDVLSELPGAWRLALRRWRHANQRRKVRVGENLAPSSNDEYLLYQTLIGVWPMRPPGPDELAELTSRVEAAMLKAAREAKLHTSWINQEPAYEAALMAFVRRVFGGVARRDAFITDFLPFQATIGHFGAYNSLNMLLLKLTVPGVPDIYQGCESWNFSLVDPDNRRPVDYASLHDRLARLEQDFPDGASVDGVREMEATRADGRIKLYLLWRTLTMRARFAETFRDGRYVPLDVEGPAARHVVAFARVRGHETVVVVATRLLFGLTGGDPARVTDPAVWERTAVTLPWRREEVSWRDALCAREVVPTRVGNRDYLELAPLFDALPLALLVPGDGGG